MKRKELYWAIWSIITGVLMGYAVLTNFPILIFAGLLILNLLIWYNFVQE